MNAKTEPTPIDAPEPTPLPDGKVCPHGCRIRDGVRIPCGVHVRGRFEPTAEELAAVSEGFAQSRLDRRPPRRLRRVK